MSANLSRRTFLTIAAGAPTAMSVRSWCAADEHGAAVDAIRRYLESLRQTDGGYGWGDQPRSHLTATHGALGCYQNLGLAPPDSRAVVEYLRGNHPFAIKRLERDIKAFEYQQIQGLMWLGEPREALLRQFGPAVRAWAKPATFPKQYEKNGEPVFEYEAAGLICRATLGLPIENDDSLLKFIRSRRRSNGTFNNTPAADDSDGNILNTYWGLSALRAVGELETEHSTTAAWIRACQRDDGGFSWQPKPPFGDVCDAVYVWAAIKSLQVLDSKPQEIERCRQWLMSLQNADGGFGPRPRWISNPVASYYVLEALNILEGMQPVTLPNPPSRRRREKLPKDLRVLSAQIEAHGSGSPLEAVDLAGALMIDLWGAKNAALGWIKAAQAIADERRVPVQFYMANEEYGTYVRLPGLGTYSHTVDLVAPADGAIGAPIPSEKPVEWEQFRHQRLDALTNGRGRLVWQFNENEALTRVYLDDSLQRGGYVAISTFHFGNPDFANSSPFLQHYRGQIPFVALQDAHGREPWWFADQTTGFRTLFLARESTWDGWLEALANNWVVAVRHDAVSGFQTWRHGGSDQAIDAVMNQQSKWQWWDNPQIRRPDVSIVALKPDSQFEAARPIEGVNLRIRCRWDNTTQGKPKTPRVRLVRLLVDGREVSTERIFDGPAASPSDVYHLHRMPGVSSGSHTAEAVIQTIGDDALASRTIAFHAD